jgi:Winged helix-turn helix
MPPQDRAHPRPPLQRRRDRWPRRPPRSRTQASHHRRQAFQDHRSGFQRSTWEAGPLRWPTTPEALDETKAAYWTLDALTDAVREMGIEVGRSQVRRILLREGVRWRNTRPWAQEPGPGVRPKRSKIVGLYTDPPPEQSNR